jgi:hypothetical protein
MFFDPKSLTPGSTHSMRVFIQGTPLDGYLVCSMSPGSMPDGWVNVCEMIVAFTIPADFNPIAAAIAVIDKQKAAALEAYQKRVAELNTQLEQYLALENAPDWSAA